MQILIYINILRSNQNIKQQNILHSILLFQIVSVSNTTHLDFKCFNLCLNYLGPFLNEVDLSIINMITCILVITIGYEYNMACTQRPFIFWIESSIKRFLTMDNTKIK